ncbi:aspartate--ammonia ligase [Mycoplasma iguanae]|uniref:Aspartate--ammonia ligase n=1 Tax=Mycoplasma iguanae TaxID=292461 RepID=A0ABY5R7P5_9MOLU|nr:aspartate--ammonia ligase [Mycoplasma iguanae]UVD81479.1 aspartate--ammonia ligase [Mycoplasma iguanae]
MYKSKLSIKETQKAIEKIKQDFPKILSLKLNLTRVSAPLFVEPSTGLNDGLNGEKAVKFEAKGIQKELEIVHSLAKWKRYALAKYNFQPGEGLYADMNAIRREEDLSKFHSFYVDQWDWEKNILREKRTEAYLEKTVKKIYESFKELELDIIQRFPAISKKLPEDITFIDSQDLEDLYPQLTPEEREVAYAKEKKAIFIKRVGYKLKSGKVQSSRAVDYDDWTLNGDIIVYHPILNTAVELSSMGIRVDSKALITQSQKPAEELKSLSPFHKELVEETLPFSIGGGIGQSRLCLFLLEKAHIGEVQVSYWTEEEIKRAEKQGINLL